MKLVVDLSVPCVCPVGKIRVAFTFHMSCTALTRLYPAKDKRGGIKEGLQPEKIFLGGGGVGEWSHIIMYDHTHLFWL